MTSLRDSRKKVFGIISALVAVNIVAIVLNAIVSFSYGNINAGDGSLFSYGILAWLLGLRHACDADHIAAIDNVTRRLALLQRESMFVGGYFALGHSTIVTIMCIVVAVSSSAAADALAKAGDIAGIIGTSVSLTFLSIIGFANIWVLVALVRRRRKLLAKGSAFDDSAKLKRSSENLQADPVIEIASDNAQLTSAADAGNDGDALTPSELLIKPSAATDDVNDNDKSGAVMAYGCFTRCCPALLRSVDRPYKMYWVGFVFGLGFDTATEVGLLAITAVTSAQDSWVFAPLFALLFTSAMTMIDTFDGLLVRWAIDRFTAERQLFFNIGVTALATLLALVAAIMQAMSLVVSTYPDDGSQDTAFIAFWRALPSEYVGMFFIAIFVLGVVGVVLSDLIRQRSLRPIHV